jgi:hypothetical protein
MFGENLMKRKILFLASICMILPALLSAQYPNIRVSRPESTRPEEVTLAINPANPQQLAAGANLNFYYLSNDGGLNWTENRLTSTLGVYGDPCVIFDATGSLYYGHLSNPPSTLGNFLDRIIVQKSMDGGATWNDGASIGLNPPKDQDKEWLAVDMTNSPFKNNLYIAWTEFDKYGSSNPNDSSRILFSRSTDFGATWARPVKVSDMSGDCIDSDNTVEGAVPAVGPNGEIYLAWSGPLGILFDKSTDGGVTFGKDRFVAAQPGGWDFEVSGIYRANGLPITACDVSSSKYRGNIYVAWSDQRQGENNADIFFIKSTDGGQNWGPVKRINDDSAARQQFFVWMTVDQITGNIYFVFYDRRNTTGDATDVYVAKSTDGGESFVNFKISDSVFTPTAGIFFGDYTNIAAHHGKVYPIWMRLDGGNLSIWMTIINDPPTFVEHEERSEPIGHFSLASSYPNPIQLSAAPPLTTISFSLPRPEEVTLKIFDLAGREIATLINAKKEAGAHQIRFDASHLASGIYFYKLTTGNLSATKKLLVVR